jgi:hypothetical protein
MRVAEIVPAGAYGLMARVADTWLALLATGVVAVINPVMFNCKVLPGELKVVNALPVITMLRPVWPSVPEDGVTERRAGVDPVTVKLLGSVAVSPPVETVTLSVPGVALDRATCTVAVVGLVTVTSPTITPPPIDTWVASCRKWVPVAAR